MKVKLLAFDSFSVRSMATRVGNILLDPGIAIGPSRYGLEPSKKELEALRKGRLLIMKELKTVKEVFISHYHYDHHPFPGDKEFSYAAYKDKVVYAKDWHNKVNLSQRKRGYVFEKIAKPIAKEIIYADGKELSYVFSPPVWHGKPNTRLGYVLMIVIKDIVFAPDVQGPVAIETAKWIIEQNPKLLIIGGPPTYMLGYKFSHKDLEKAIENMKYIIDHSSIKTIVVDHHLLRDLDYKHNFGEVFSYGEQKGVIVETAAEFMNKKILQLEARRKELK